MVGGEVSAEENAWIQMEAGTKRLEELFNNELRNTYCSAYITRITTSRRMR